MNEVEVLEKMANLDSILWWVDIAMIVSIVKFLVIVGTILWIISYVLKSWWLYNINKKLWEEYPWLSWIPVVQMYSFVKAWWKEWIWILWIILWYILLIIPWMILTAMVWAWIAKRTDRWFWSAVWIFFISPIMLPIIWYKLKEKQVDKNETEELKWVYENIISDLKEF